MPKNNLKPDLTGDPVALPAANSPANTGPLSPYSQLGEIYAVTNQAIQEISQADSVEQALALAGEALAKSPLACFQFLADKDFLLSGGLLKETTARDTSGTEGRGDISLRLSRIEQLLGASSPLTVHMDEQATLPSDLVTLLASSGLKSAVLIPVWRSGRLFILYFLGSQRESEINPLTIQPYVILAAQVSTTIDKVLAMAHLQKRVAGLQSLATISQAISVVTDLKDLYELIHEKISQVMGDLDLAITLYDPKKDMISIPYAYEAGQEISLPPFPLGEGLTSILIHTQQPLMLVENTEQRAIELGAKIAGAPAKSWLGVPLIVSGEVIGAIIVQDPVHEHRFDMDDMRLLTTLGAQVAITVKNIQLFHETRDKAERERMTSEINARIWSSPDVENIARTALNELCIALRATRGTIRLSNSFIEAPAFTPAAGSGRAGLDQD